MTEVISYRTEKLEELKKLAKVRNVSLSQLSSNIIDEFLEFKELTTKYRMHSDSEKLISHVFELLDESAIEKIIDAYVEEHVDTIKTVTNDFSVPSILNLAKTWTKFNDIPIEEFSEESNLKIVCKNNLSLNWNKMIAKSWIKIFENFGHSGIEDVFKEGMFSVKISKQKSH